MMMKIEEKLLRQIVSDLGLDVPFSRGKNIPVNNCWHFSTDGNAVEAIFQNEDDFISGMNRVYLTVRGFRVIILAFCLMDTHVHFVLYGEYDECNRFMHEFIRRTSWDISVKHGESKKLKRIPISHQKVDTDFYLKLVICYTIKNPSVIQAALKSLDLPLDSLESIRKSITIEGVIPENAIDRITMYKSVYEQGNLNAGEKMLETSYFPTQYRLTFNYSSSGLSGKDSLRGMLSRLQPKQEVLLLGYGVPMPLPIRSRLYDETFWQQLLGKDGLHASLPDEADDWLSN